jgi:dTDP-glucose pyrophosphorylase
MILGGANKICFVISPGKSDILEYYGGNIGSVSLSYVVQPRPAGLCDAIFRTVPFIPAEEFVTVGLPDTIWFPDDGLSLLPREQLSFLLFPVEHPEFFDAVVTDPDGRVKQIQVKQQDASSTWIWGAFGMPGGILHELHELWVQREKRDEYFGTLVNAFLEEGGRAQGVFAGQAYVDVGTLNGYREAMKLLGARAEDGPLPELAERHIRMKNMSSPKASAFRLDGDLQQGEKRKAVS